MVNVNEHGERRRHGDGLRVHPPTVSHPNKGRSSSSLGCAILPGRALDKSAFARDMTGATVVIAVAISLVGARVRPRIVVIVAQPYVVG